MRETQEQKGALIPWSLLKINRQSTHAWWWDASQQKLRLRSLPNFPRSVRIDSKIQNRSHIVTFFGSPPKAAILSRIHSKAKSSKSCHFIKVLKTYITPGTYDRINRHLRFRLPGLPFHLGIQMLKRWKGKFNLLKKIILTIDTVIRRDENNWFF
jgi:hypothetical protein